MLLRMTLENLVLLEGLTRDVERQVLGVDDILDEVKQKEKQNDTKLYVRHVFGTDNYEDLIPKYLEEVKRRTVEGVSGNCG